MQIISIRVPYVIKWANLIPFDPHCWPLECPKKGENFKRVKNECHHCFHDAKWIGTANFQHLSAIYNQKGKFVTFWPPLLTRGVPQKGWKFQTCQKWMLSLFSWCKMNSYCQFSASECHKWPNGQILTLFDPRLPPGVPQKGSIFHNCENRT